MFALDKIKAALADTQNLEPAITDKGEIILSQEQIDEQVSRLNYLIEAIGQGSLL